MRLNVRGLRRYIVVPIRALHNIAAGAELFVNYKPAFHILKRTLQVVVFLLFSIIADNHLIPPGMFTVYCHDHEQSHPVPLSTPLL